MENDKFYYKYLKYKSKYLKLKEEYKNQVGGNGDEMIKHMAEIYKSVLENFDFVYLTGSMALYIIVYFVNQSLDDDKKIIFPEDLMPNDVDMMVHIDTRKPIIYIKGIGNYLRKEDAPQRALKFQLPEEAGGNMFRNFDLLSTYYKKKHYKFDYILNNEQIVIKILLLEDIKIDYIHDEKFREKDTMKIKLINEIQDIIKENNVEPPIYNDNKRKKQEARSSSSSSFLDDLNAEDSPIKRSRLRRHFEFTQNLKVDEGDEGDEVDEVDKDDEVDEVDKDKDL